MSCAELSIPAYDCRELQPEEFSVGAEIPKVILLRADAERAPLVAGELCGIDYINVQDFTCHSISRCIMNFAFQWMSGRVEAICHSTRGCLLQVSRASVDEC